MNQHPTCGLWPAKERIAASVLDGGGRLHRIWMAPADEDECWNCLVYLERDFGLDVRLVVPEHAAPLRAVARSALQRDMPVLVAPSLLIETIAATAFSRPRPRHYASVMARLPDSHFRSYLRLLLPRDPRQMLLL